MEAIESARYLDFTPLSRFNDSSKGPRTSGRSFCNITKVIRFFGGDKELNLSKKNHTLLCKELTKSGVFR